jgi:hypothetical protein
MSSHSKRNLGAMEAQKDNNFENHFIEVQNLEKIIDNDSDIIYGLKGSGKTALCRALTELNKDIFFTTKLINLDSISFSQIHSALEALRSTTNKEVVNLASKTWHNVLLIYGIETYAESLPDNDDLKNKINAFVKKKKYTNTKSNNRIHTFLQNLIIKIRDLGFSSTDESPLGLTSGQFEEIDKTFDDELYELILESKKSLSHQNKKILLCLDGFDSIIDHTEESRKAIFSGLVDAIYKCSKDTFISDNFCFKAFLPRELTEDVRMIHFDADKFIFNSHYLNWAKREFEELLIKRLTPYSRTKSKSFTDIWNEHFPEKIYNSVHSTEENTFDYILRHTLYRPRHLLIHLQYIIDEWDLKYTSQKIHPSSIPKIVCQTNSKLSELISAELEYAINGITQFLHSFNSVSCTTEFSFFTSRMRKMFGIDTRENERKLFDKLYNIGIIGYYKKADLAKKKTNTMGCSFAYSSSLNNRQIFNSLDDEDIVVLSPIFQEYCGCDYSNYGIIYQK